MDNKPWVCIDDFNELLSSDEKWGGFDHQNYLIQNFQNALMDYVLSDISCTEKTFLHGIRRGTDRL